MFGWQVSDNSEISFRRGPSMYNSYLRWGLKHIHRTYLGLSGALEMQHGLDNVVHTHVLLDLLRGKQICPKYWDPNKGVFPSGPNRSVYSCSGGARYFRIIEVSTITAYGPLSCT